jgi:hypothetical protein
LLLCIFQSWVTRAPISLSCFESGLRMMAFVVLLISGSCSLLGVNAMNALWDVAVFFFPFRSSYFVFIDSLSLKLVDVLVLEEWCKVIILDSIMDSRFASLQQVLLASLLFFDLFSCWSASLNCLEDENSKRGFYDLHLHSSR